MRNRTVYSSNAVCSFFWDWVWLCIALPTPTYHHSWFLLNTMCTTPWNWPFHALRQHARKLSSIPQDERVQLEPIWAPLLPHTIQVSVYLGLFCGAHFFHLFVVLRVGTEGLACARQVLYHWTATSDPTAVSSWEVSIVALLSKHKWP
jgi:hypothetical protein